MRGLRADAWLHAASLKGRVGFTGPLSSVCPLPPGRGGTIILSLCEFDAKTGSSFRLSFLKFFFELSKHVRSVSNGVFFFFFFW